MPSDTIRGDDLHKQFPKQFKRDEFWEQIKRTVNGKPVAEADIQLIVSQINQYLDLQPTDHLLDLGCGNAALGSRLFPKIDKYTGVDFSQYLLEIAREFFQPDQRFDYVESDIREVNRYSQIQAPDKILIYGCIAYLSKPETRTLIQQLASTFPEVQRMLIGNVPNRSLAKDFFAKRGIEDCQLDDPQTPIGVWWDPEEFVQMGHELEIQMQPVYMPPEFYGSPYRFDICLTF